MNTERQLQFRVGVMVLISAAIGGWLIYEFGDLKQYLRKRYALAIQFESGSGLYPTAPVTLSGLVVGNVRTVQLNPNEKGVIATVDVSEDIRIPVNSSAVIVRSILGETTIEITPGTEKKVLKPGGRFRGELAVDPLEMVQRMEGRAIEVLSALNDTTREWQAVAKNVNSIMETNRGNLGTVVERAAESLHEFTETMQHANTLLASANKIVGDEATQKALQEALIGMPKLVNETQLTIAETRGAITETRSAIASSRQVLDGVNRNLVNLNQITEPVGKRGEQMVAKLDSSLSNLDQLTLELSRFAKMVNAKDGSLQKMATDPALYNNLERSSQSLAVLLRNADGVLRDLREFSDKVARNPELLGVGGAVRPSTGLKDAETLQKSKTVLRGNNP